MIHDQTVSQVAVPANAPLPLLRRSCSKMPRLDSFFEGRAERVEEGHRRGAIDDAMIVREPQVAVLALERRAIRPESDLIHDRAAREDPRLAGEDEREGHDDAGVMTEGDRHVPVAQI